ncbi:MAG: hypothetical protein HOP33_08970 [Verrucomicrobia bacterium]|nr:hypothetical protein [Verrucomicrobiota bacterium]
MKPTLIAALLLLAANCLGQTLTMSHQGFGCPGQDHPWPSGDVTNSVNHLDTDTYGYTEAGGMVLLSDNPVTTNNWSSKITLVSLSGTPAYDVYYYVTDRVRYEDECVFHTNTWFSEFVLFEGTLSSSATFSNLSWSTLGEDLVGYGSTFEFHSSSLFLPWSLWMEGGPNFYEDAVHPPSTPLVWDRWPLPAVQPGPNNYGPQSIQMNAHHDQIFALYTSTNLTNWSYVTNIVADEYGWVEHDVSTNLLSIEQQFWQLVYTNSP